MTDLVEFLRARLDEDERELAKDPPVGLGYADLGARMRREVAAKRRRLARYEQAMNEELGEWQAARELMLAARGVLLGVLKEDAAVYSDHPDYHPEWKP